MAATYSINDSTAQEARSYNSITDILNLLPDNTQKLINPKDVRDAVFSTWENSVFRYTTIGSNEYIGLNRDNIKTKLYFGKKQLSNATIMSTTLLNSDTDIFFFNNKLDTNPSQNLKISLIGGTDSSIYQYAPYLESAMFTSGSTHSLNLNIVNPGPLGGDINLSSSYGRLSLNGLTIPTYLEITNLVNNPTESNVSDLFLTRNSSGFIEFKKVKVDFANIGTALSTTNIYGTDVFLNDYSLEFTDMTPTSATFGGIGVGTTFSKVPLSEMIRMMLYPYLGPLSDIDINTSAILERSHYTDVVINYDFTLTKRTNNITSSSILVTSGNILLSNKVGPSVTGPGLIIQNTTDSYTLSYSNINSSTTGLFTFSCVSTDGTQSSTASAGVQFIYPYFYNTSPTLATNTSTMNSILVSDLDKKVGVKEDQTLSVFGSNEYLYLAYPLSYGTISTIYDVNNYLLYQYGVTSSTWTYSIISVNSPDGYWNGTSYLVYRTINKVTIPYPQNYKFNY